MEGIPEEDLHEHEKRLAGKDKDDSEPVPTPKGPPVLGAPPMPPIGMMGPPPMMPMAFTGIPFGMPPMPLPMMSVQMMTQMRPPMPMMPPVAANPGAMMPTNPMMGQTNSIPSKPLFPSGSTEVSNCF